MTSRRSPERIIEDQVKIWARHQEQARSEPVRHRPLITISRAFGARGDAVGRLIASRVGFDVWDRNIVEEIANASGGDLRILSSLDEHRRTTIDDAIRGFLRGADHTNVQYFRALVRVVRTIAEHGSAVIIGRGANCIVSADRALRVRITAPEAWRIQSVAERTGRTVRQVTTDLRERDAERADFVRHHFRQAIDDATTYDIVLNAATLDLEAMTDLVLATYAARFASVTRPVRQAGR